MMKTSNTHHIPCGHTHAPDVEVIPDHHPLTNAEIRDLCEGSLTRDGRALASIQVRLIQAIQGMECPRPIEGEVAETMKAVETTFVDSRSELGFDEWVSKIQRLINGGGE